MGPNKATSGPAESTASRTSVRGHRNVRAGTQFVGPGTPLWNTIPIHLSGPLSLSRSRSLAPITHTPGPAANCCSDAQVRCGFDLEVPMTHRLPSTALRDQKKLSLKGPQAAAALAGENFLLGCSTVLGDTRCYFQYRWMRTDIWDTNPSIPCLSLCAGCACCVSF